jgi:Tfp pilus assembly protein PilF/4-amino-4-deoxy-L-arabinose transferase-like glycosyltransferase
MKPSSRPQPAPQDDARRESFAWLAAAIFLVALVVRLTHVWQIRRAPFFTVLMGDARAYDEWAQQIARGDWIGHEVFYQAPLYPYFLGLIYTIAGRSLLAVRVCQAIIGSVSCALLGFAAHRMFSRSVGLIAGLCLALYAPAIFFDGLLQKSVLDVFFICLMLWLLGGLMNHNHQTHREARKVHNERSSWSFWSSWFGLGLSAGALSLTRENALVFIAVILLWAVTQVGMPRRERMTAAGLFLVGLALVLAPVAVRNRIVGGEFFVTTSQFGPNFYIGNHARSDGTYMSLRYGRGAPEYERQDARDLAEQATGRQLTPAEVSSYWTERAFDFITSQPAAWLKLVARKFALVWNRTEMLDTESQEAYAEWSLPVRVAGHVGHFGVLVPLAFLGVCLTWPQRQKLWVLYAMLATYAASVVMFYVFARYRYPLVPFLILFGSVALAAALGYIWSKPHIKIRPWILAAIVVVAVFANWPILSTDLMRAITETNLAVALQSEGKLDEATDHYRRAMALKADYAPAYNNLGVALRAKGQVNAAVATYQRAIALEPNYPDAHFNLANALLAEGKVDEAIDHFRLALQLSPGGVDVHNNLGIALASKGHLDEAVAEFRVALQLDPGSAWTHRNLGDSLASQGRTDEAADHLQRAVRLDPENGQAHYDLASLLLEAHKFAEATDEFRTAVRLMPDSAEAINNLGVALGSSGRLDEAIDQFRQALQRKPDFIDAERNLAMALAARRQMPRVSGSR